MKDIGRHVLENEAMGVPPDGYRTAEQKRSDEMATKIGSVATILEFLGYCPVTELVNAARKRGLTEQQKAAINKWLMEQAYKGSTLEVKGKVEHEHTHRAIQEINEFLGRYGLGEQESGTEEISPH